MVVLDQLALRRSSELLVELHPHRLQRLPAGATPLSCPHAYVMVTTQNDAEIQISTMSSSQTDLSSAQIRSRNPLLLNAAQEAEVRAIYHERVRRKCRLEIEGIASSRLALANFAHTLSRLCQVRQSADPDHWIRLPRAAPGDEYVHAGLRDTG